MEKKVVAKKLSKILAGALLIFLLGGLGGVFFQRYVLPNIKANKTLSRISFLKHATENVTVINKTEQLTVKEDDSINELAKQPVAAVANIISVSAPVKQQSWNKFALASQPTSKSGSGVIATSDGVIITYRSAILEKDAKYAVLLADGSRYGATLMGVDEFTNLAFLKIEASNLPVISFADATSILPGKKIIAIGSSFGEYKEKYAMGLLSGFNRTFNLGGHAISFSDKLEGVYQVDFNEESEYVGGPAVGYDGALVGINGFVLVDNKPVYFQIPVENVKKALDLALHNELTTRPVFGTYYIPITKAYAIAHNMELDRGALIALPGGRQGAAVSYGSVAEKAGLKTGDVITMVNNQGVNLDNPLANLLSQYKKGSKIELTAMRAGQEIKLAVNL